jgi:hypothetical protein
VLRYYSVDYQTADRQNVKNQIGQISEKVFLRIIRLQGRGNAENITKKKRGKTQKENSVLIGV